MLSRTSIDAALEALLAALVTAAPDVLGQIDARRVLVVFAAARKDAHASIRPLSFGGHPPRYESADGRLHKPRVLVNGREMLYEIALRPRFFLDTDAAQRVSILAHELFHVDPSFDGRLAEDRRHERARSDEIERAVREIVERWRAAGAEGRRAVEGSSEVTLRAWRERPPSRLLEPARDRRVYTEQHLYDAVVRFET